MRGGGLGEGDLLGLVLDGPRLLRGHRVLLGVLALELPHHAADERRTSLRLRVDVEGDGDEQDQTADDLHLVGLEAHQLQAVRQQGHHETTDDRAGDRADTTGDRGTTDEHRGDRVELPAGAVSGAGGARVGDEHHAGDGGEDRHVHHHEEVDLLRADTGEDRGAGVATDRVDLAAEDRVLRDEAVDDGQDAEDDRDDRDRGADGAGAEQVRGDEGDARRGRRCGRSRPTAAGPRPASCGGGHGRAPR